MMLYQASNNAPSDASATLSPLDQLVCQKLASIIKQDVPLVTTILSRLIEIKRSAQLVSGIVNPMTAYLLDAEELYDLTQRKPEEIEDILNKINLPSTVFCEQLFQIIRLVKLVEQLSLVKSTADQYDDITILLDIVKLNTASNQFITLKDIQSLTQLKQLRKDTAQSSNEFLYYFHEVAKEPSLETTKNTFLTLMHWDKETFDYLMKQFNITLQKNIDHHTILQINVLSQAFSLLAKFNNDTYILSLVAKTMHSTQSNEYAVFKQLAETLYVTVAKRYPKELDTANRNLHEQKRDVLVRTIINSLSIQQEEAIKIHTVEDLSAHLLLDLQMSGCFSTSYIAQGIASLQLYLQRCRLGIEPGVQLTLSETWWPWLENYRSWEANRKILLYPESYVEPDLRIEQSAEFKQLTQTLLQANLDSTSIHDTFRQYFQQLAELGNLVYCDACVGKVAQNDSSTTTLYLFAHTRNSPYQFHFRTLTYPINNINEAKWSYWNKIDVTINAELISPIFIHNRLFLFWVESQLVAKTQLKGRKPDAEQKPVDNNDQYLVAKYVYQNANGTWSSVQSLGEQCLPGLISVKNDPFTINHKDTQINNYNWYKIQHIKSIEMKQFNVRLNESNYLQWKYYIDLTMHFDFETRMRFGMVESSTLEESEQIYKDIEKEFPCTMNIIPKVAFKLHESGELLIQYPVYEPDPKLNNVTFPVIFTKKPSGAAAVKEMSIEFTVPIKYNIPNMFRVNEYRLDANLLVTSQPATLAPTSDKFFEQEFYPSDKPGYKALDYEVDTKTFVFKPENAPGYIAKTSPYADLISVKVLGIDENETKKPLAIINNIDESYLFQYGAIQGNKKFSLNQLSNTHIINRLNQTILLGTPADLLSHLDDNSNIDVKEALSVTDDVYYQSISRKINFADSYGPYYWELFFYIPTYIANQLNARQQFEQARSWYHFIFNPLTAINKNNLSAFIFPPFKQEYNNSFNDLFTNKLMQAYHEHAFDPHAVASARPIAYMKYIVMKYIKNLIDWGDSLFSQNTRESINLAINLYVMAKDLLGDKPRALGSTKPQKRTLTFKDYIVGGMALNEVNQLILKEIENANNLTQPAAKPIHEFNLFFGIPENKEFIAYWNRIEDRLFKIRHCLTINGIRQELDLFAPELDVRQLVRAAAAGDIDIKNMLPLTAPHYRFEFLIEHARGLCVQLQQLGMTLNAVLEKQDSEQLALMINNQQSMLMEQILAVKHQQVDEANYMLEQFKISLNAVKARKDYFTQLLQQRLIPEENEAMFAKRVMQDFYLASQGLSTLGSFAALLPDITFGTPAFVGSTVGGSYAANMFRSGAEVARVGGDIFSQQADDLLTQANYKRREQEWQQQEQQAEYDTQQLEKQLQIAQLHVDVAKQELFNQQLGMQQNKEILDYYQHKFTNIDLYRWMADQLIVIYRQYYELALSASKAAEQAYQFEMDTQKQFITPNHYSFFRKGLLAGESLSLELSRLQKNFVDDNERLLEIEKTISLKDVKTSDGKALALDEFKANHVVNFKTIADMFIKDFPQLTNRKIKRIIVSIPGLAKPYQNYNFILEQIGTLGPDNNPEKIQSWRVGDRITITSGVNDTGLFANTLQDPRYLPFEGTSVYAEWRLGFAPKMKDLSAPIDEDAKKLIQSINNIIIQIQYTAKMEGQQNTIKLSNNKITFLGQSSAKVQEMTSHPVTLGHTELKLNNI